MSNKKDINSSLKLEKTVFDRIEFKRLGFKSEDSLKLEIQSSIGKRQDEDIYRVTLLLKGNKPSEYTFEIELSGYFSIETDEKMTEQMKNALLQKNTVAILMPYLRSEVSLLTAQPEVDCVVLPVFNINKMLDK